MPKPYARIAITLPQQDLAAADRLARAHDRSRSWIVAEAIRQYVAAAATPSAQTGRRGRAANATATVATVLPATAGLGDSRLAQLKRDLALTPEARVREAEETLRLTEHRGRSRGHRILAFDRYEDFLEWQRTRDAAK